MRGRLGLRQIGDLDDQHLEKDMKRHVEDLQVLLEVKMHKVKEARTKTHEEKEKTETVVRHRICPVLDRKHH